MDECTRDNDHEFVMEHQGKDQRSVDRSSLSEGLRELHDMLFSRIRALEDEVARLRANEAAAALGISAREV